MPDGSNARNTGFATGNDSSFNGAKEGFFLGLGLGRSVTCFRFSPRLLLRVALASFGSAKSPTDCEPSSSSTAPSMNVLAPTAYPAAVESSSPVGPKPNRELRRRSLCVSLRLFFNPRSWSVTGGAAIKILHPSGASCTTANSSPRGLQVSKLGTSVLPGTDPDVSCITYDAPPPATGSHVNTRC